MAIWNCVLKLGTRVKDIINPRRLYIHNYFGSSLQRKVLISYLTQPFFSKPIIGHTNNQESLEIAKIFNDAGCQVDIVRYNGDFNKIKFKNKEYDIVFGLEPNFLKAVDKFSPDISIYYATGAYYAFQNAAEYQRLLNLKERTGIMLRPQRFVPPHNSFALADAIISIGNKWTKSTFGDASRKTKSIRVSAYSFFNYDIIKKNKNWKKARFNFLYFGSSGLILKGLDILLDIFKNHSMFNLYVCGSVSNEKDFIKIYRNELFNSPNIHFIGWISPDSDKFRELISKCAFTILPSCSEGMSSSTATCMFSGLIPIVSKQTGIDVESCGIILENNEIETIEKSIFEAANMSESKIVELSNKSFQCARENHSLEIFSEDFKKALTDIINEAQKPIVF
jgi:glycosyltransferase involved in cell wall biosynthesis